MQVYNEETDATLKGSICLINIKRNDKCVNRYTRQKPIASPQTLIFNKDILLIAHKIISQWAPSRLLPFIKYNARHSKCRNMLRIPKHGIELSWGVGGGWVGNIVHVDGWEGQQTQGLPPPPRSKSSCYATVHMGNICHFSVLMYWSL